MVTNTETSRARLPGRAQRPSSTSYEGTGGIPIGNVLQRALFAWRFRDVNLLISDQINGDSRIMIYRDIQTRVTQGRAVPHVRLRPVPRDRRRAARLDLGRLHDDEPVPVLGVGRTCADGHRAGLLATLGGRRELPPQLGEGGRRRVQRHDHVLRDDGPDGDPIMQAWAARVPGAVHLDRPGAAGAAASTSATRRTCSRSRRTQFANYHVTEREVFYQKQDFWAIPDDPTTAQEAAAGHGRQPRIRPYYLLMKTARRHDGAVRAGAAVRAADRQNMVAWIAAKSDPAELRPDR